MRTVYIAISICTYFKAIWQLLFNFLNIYFRRSLAWSVTVTLCQLRPGPWVWGGNLLKIQIPMTLLDCCKLFCCFFSDIWTIGIWLSLPSNLGLPATWSFRSWSSDRDLVIHTHESEADKHRLAVAARSFQVTRGLGAGWAPAVVVNGCSNGQFGGVTGYRNIHHEWRWCISYWKRWTSS